MGATEEGIVLGWEDFDIIVKDKEKSLKMIEANKRHLAVGEEVEKLILKHALKQRSKYPKPEPEDMAEDEKPTEEEKKEE